MTTANQAREHRIQVLCLPFILLGLLHLVLAFASLPVYIQRIQTLTIVPYKVGSTIFFSNQGVQQAAIDRGMSLNNYALYQAVFNGSLSLFFAALAGLILWKARRHFFGWYTASVLMMLCSYPLVDALRQSQFIPQVLLEGGSVFWPLYLLFFYVFPNGQEAPRWARWPIGILLFVHLLGQLLGTVFTAFPVFEPFFNAILPVIGASITLNFLLILGSQIYRYRFVSTPVERQQTKVFVAGLSLMLGTSLIFNFFDHFPFKAEIDAIQLVCGPLAVAIAILRFHLWDIDLIIRRTLLYALLSSLLGLVYYGSVVILNQLMKGITGESSFALVVSTLLIAALFNPLRRRLQSVIDHRFYRPKYDAASTLQHFSEIVRNEVELQELSYQLNLAVHTTIQPKDLSLWIRPVEVSDSFVKP